MINPRPHLLLPAHSIFTSSSAVTVAVGKAAAGAVGAVTERSVAGLAAALATAGSNLAFKGANDWHKFHSDMSAANGLAEPYVWHNANPASFNALTSREIGYKIVVSFAIAIAAKVLFKVIPSFIFGALFKFKLIKPAAVHTIDCFGRSVPDAKSYVVEVPVR